MIKSHQSKANAIYVVIISVFAFLPGLAVTVRSQSAEKPQNIFPKSSRSEPKTTGLMFPISVELVGSDEPLVIGRSARELRVIIRNTTPLAGKEGVAMPIEAIVLQSVHWASERDDDRQWLGPIHGSTRIHRFLQFASVRQG